MDLVFLTIVIALTGFNLAVHWYTQLMTYSLFPAIAAAAGGPAFTTYHRQYEKRLPVAVYLPWALLTVASIGLIFWRPQEFPIAVVIPVLLLNASIAPISIIFAAPIHRSIDRDDTLSPADARALLRWNATRLVIMSVSFATILIATAVVIMS